MEATRKGVSSIGKYQFGPYKIVSGKAGWTKTESKSIFFSFETKSESKKKSSFVFVGNDKDSVLVNTSTNTKTSDIELGDLSILNQSKNNFIALLSFTNDTTVWRMIVVTRSGEEVEGILTNGITEIQIREVKQWEDGKTAAFNLIMGYEFFLNNNSIAAVQANIDTFQKKFVWLHQNLDARMKLVLAAASASLMIRVDDANSE